MSSSTDRHWQRAKTLRDRIKVSLALDDAMAGELHSAARVLAARGDREGAALMTEAVRRHRVGAIKQRAIMAAKGIDV